VSSRAGIVVTGTEVLTGRVSDRNGPWLAEQLRLLGVDVAQVIVVGDRRADLAAALSFLARSNVDLVVTSGGLGPTADDLTAEVVAEFQHRLMEVDEALHVRIAGIVQRLSAGRGWTLDPEATAHSNRKQANVPAGAHALEPVGTAPGLVVPPPPGSSSPLIVVLPGPPRELQPMWLSAVSDPLVTDALAGREEIRQRTIRLWGTPESELAAVLRENESRFTELEITTCLREGELEIVTRYHPQAENEYQDMHATIGQAFAATAFSLDGRTIDEIVADALTESASTIATAESCTGGLLASRLSAQPGASAYLLGGLVTYANSAKIDLAEVPAELIGQFGAVSEEVATAMADGARNRFGAEIGIGISGVAGPTGGTEAKPVGLVQLCLSRKGQTVAQRVQLPGDRIDVRTRAVMIAMHMIRQAFNGG
jgi:nicotinamide-nucleotide amidase